MERNTTWAVSLLGYIVNNDHEGIGLYRSELRLLFERDPTVEVENGQSSVALDYHLRLLESAGFVTKETDIDGKNDFDNFELTWAGHHHFEENAPSEHKGFFTR